jgi:hypothetical protein
MYQWLSDVQSTEVGNNFDVEYTRDNWHSDMGKLYCEGNTLYILPQVSESDHLCTRCLVLRTLSSGLRISSENHAREVPDTLRKLADVVVESRAPDRSDGRYRVYEVNLTDGAVSHSFVLPLPGCDTCWREAPNSLPDWANGIDHSVGRCGGIIRDLQTEQLVLNGVEFPVWISRVRQVSSYSLGDAVASGRGMTPEDARTSGIGEALEHYAFDFFLAGAGEHPKQNNSGWASHVSRQAALEKAKYELVERDAFLRAWTSGVFRGADHVSSGINELKDIASKLKAVGLNLLSRKCPTILVGTFCHLAVIWHDSKFNSLPHTVTGLGCARSERESVLSAVLEAVQMIPAVSYHTKHREHPPSEEDYGPADHAKHYGQTFRSAALRPIFEVGFGGTCSDQIEELDFEANDRSPNDLRALGIYVMQARSKVLLPLRFGRDVDTRKCMTLHPLS